jgi:hypothetical protein
MEQAGNLQERGGLDIREAFIDGSFVPAKKGAGRSAGQNGAKEAGSWQLRTLPVSACLASASPHEVKLAEKAPGSLFISGKPDKLIGDKADDSDELLQKKYGIELIAPHRRNRKAPPS